MVKRPGPDPSHDKPKTSIDKRRKGNEDSGPVRPLTALPSRSDSGLPAELRQQRIAALVAEQGFVRVRELSERFGVSAVTLRNDLDQLERRGELRRVHGGATSGLALGEPTFEEASESGAGEKAAIGRAAAALVRPGEALILDVGTTTTAVARALVERTDLHDVTVFTNGLTIALELERAAAITVVVTGGTLRPRQHSLVNPLATTVIEQIRAGTVFLGCNGFDLDAGVTNINLPEAEVKRAMARAARRRVVVADSRKLGEVALAPVCPVDDVDVLVTDAGAPAAFLQALRTRGVDVVVAG